MTTTGHEDEDRRIDAELAPYFAAARAARPSPPLHVMSAILADAAEVGALRAAPPVPAPRRRRVGAKRGFGIGAALVAATIAGFAVGLAGAIDVSIPGTSAATAAAEADPVAGFFDLAMAE
jgi:hypothetical protein